VHLDLTRTRRRSYACKLDTEAPFRIGAERLNSTDRHYRASDFPDGIAGFTKWLNSTSVDTSCWSSAVRE
jgi:hypothetical protein